jgi:hypothetical protein
MFVHVSNFQSFSRHRIARSNLFPFSVLFGIVWECCKVEVYLSMNSYWPSLWSSGQSSWLQNGDVSCFLWGTNWIYVCYVEESRPPLWFSGQSSWLQNGDVSCLLWGTNWIYVCYVEESRQPLLSSGQSSWIQNGDGSCFLWDTNWISICYVEESRPPLWSRRYQILCKVVGVERGPFSLLSTIEELLERNSSGFGLERR